MESLLVLNYKFSSCLFRVELGLVRVTKLHVFVSEPNPFLDVNFLRLVPVDLPKISDFMSFRRCLLSRKISLKITKNDDSEN